ncbi:PH domain-containing protein [Gordonia sp. CPCC 205333]|uniref:PH domain-containing protein n=1 Tax=Gordonia sp. CPCC 205333 TaxID=3140790 RepID=UPI003AF403B7
MAEPNIQSWSSPKPFAYGLIAGGVALSIAAIVTFDDPAGSVLMVIAALLLFGFGGTAAAVRPRLRLVSTGGTPTVTIRTIFGAQTYAAADVARLRILDFRRMGRRIGHLEFEFEPQRGSSGEPTDDDTRIIVMGRWELGADIHEVADALEAAGFQVER